MYKQGVLYFVYFIKIIKISNCWSILSNLMLPEKDIPYQSTSFCVKFIRSMFDIFVYIIDLVTLTFDLNLTVGCYFCNFDLAFQTHPPFMLMVNPLLWEGMEDFADPCCLVAILFVNPSLSCWIVLLY